LDDRPSLVAGLVVWHKRKGPARAILHGMPKTHSLSGRVVAVTGGARGIGRATAQALLNQGARVAIGDIDGDVAAATVSELGGDLEAFALDVTDRESFAEFLDGVIARFGKLDVLINNAGIMPVGPFRDETDKTADRILDINVRGVILGSKLALERMAPRRSGHIVNIASQAGKAGFAGGATYCASKHAVVGLTHSLADELHGSGVEVTVVMPAIVNTELSSGVAPTRFVKPVEAADVADAIVAALLTPRLNVHVPKSAIVTGLVGSLPHGVRVAVSRLLNADNALLGADRAARAAYEARAAGQERVRA
jgi:NAD(P)-dependent dehydrogenase (short-subunit alcohol dehydrogenase family)